MGRRDGKVLHVTHGSLPESSGGVESYLRVLLGGQRAAGVDARLLTGSMVVWPEAGIETLEVDGVPVFRLHRDDLYFDHFAKLWHPGAERLIDELLEREVPDLLHVHQWIRLTCNLVELADRRGIPAVVTLHDLYTSCPRCFRVRPGDEACFRPLSVESCLGCVPRFGHESEAEVKESIELYRDQYQAELSAARSILVADGATADLISETTGFPREGFEVLPLAYQRRWPTGAPAPAPLPAAGEPFRFGYWGNLTRRKGAQVLLEAFRSLVRAGAPRAVELHLFGRIDTAALQSELDGLAAGLPVSFHGRYDYGQVAAAGLHMAVFPMLCFETYGFVLDECFELGLPCIVTDIGAIPRRAGEAALKVEPKDPGALAQAMASVLARPALRDELRARVPGPGLLPVEHLARVREVYERVLVARRPAGAHRVPAWRRGRLMMLQRESAQARLDRGGGPR